MLGKRALEAWSLEMAGRMTIMRNL